MSCRVGILSDTHGLLRPEALALLRGCERIIHAGDIGPGAILEQLSTIAPVTAVRGNNDTDAWAARLPVYQNQNIAGSAFHVLHDLALLDIDPVAAGIAVVVYGHSHKPSVERRDNVLYVNPGSAGPRRFSLPITIAEIVVDGRDLSARIQNLAIRVAAGPYQ